MPRQHICPILSRQWHQDGHGFYAYIQDGWRKGAPTMVNEISISVRCSHLAETGLESRLDDALFDRIGASRA